MIMNSTGKLVLYYSSESNLEHDLSLVNDSECLEKENEKIVFRKEFI